MSRGTLPRLIRRLAGLLKRFVALAGPLAPVGCLYGVKPTFHLVEATVRRGLPPTRDV